MPGCAFTLLPVLSPALGADGPTIIPWLGWNDIDGVCADAMPDVAPSMAALASKSFRIVFTPVFVFGPDTWLTYVRRPF